MYRNHVIEHELKLCGYFCIITSEKMTNSQALIHYKWRAISEKLFSSDKSFIGSKSMGVQASESMLAKKLIEFIALSACNRIYNLLKETMLKSETRTNCMTVPAEFMASNCSSCFFDVIVLCQISFFIFETAEPPLDYDIILLAAFSIHVLSDSVFFCEIYEPLAGKLTSLIRIQNPGFALLKVFFQSCNHHSGIQGVVYISVYNTAAIPIDDSCRVQISVSDWDISNIIDRV